MHVTSDARDQLGWKGPARYGGATCQFGGAPARHVLEPWGVPPRTLRSTRLVHLATTMDPKLVAAAFGMDPKGVMIYLADRVDEGRLPDQQERRR